MTAALALPSARALRGWGASRLLLLSLVVISRENQALGATSVLYRWAVGAWSDGALPGRDFPWEYPPGALPFVLLLPVGRSPVAYVALFVLQVLVVDLLVLGVLTAVHRRIGDPRGLVLWIAFVPLLGLPTLTSYDIVPALLAAVALVLCREHPALAAGLMVVGTSIKVWPAVLLLLLVVAGHNRCWAAASAVATSCGLWLIFAAGGVLSAVGSTVRFHMERGLQVEAPVALPLMWARLLGHTVEVRFAHGASEVSGYAASVLTWLSAVVGLVVTAWVLWAAWAHRQPAPTAADLVVPAAALVTVLVLSAKVLSPQYLLWIGVLVSLAAGYGRLARTDVLLCAGAALTTHLVYPLSYPELLAGRTLPLLLLTLRDGLLLVLAVRLVARSVRAPNDAVRSDTIHPPVPVS